MCGKKAFKALNFSQQTKRAKMENSGKWKRIEALYLLEYTNLLRFTHYDHFIYNLFLVLRFFFALFFCNFLLHIFCFSIQHSAYVDALIRIIYLKIMNIHYEIVIVV